MNATNASGTVTPTTPASASGARSFPGTPMMRALAAAMEANLPVLIWGEPGVGKTSVLSAAAATWGMPIEVVVASIREATDFLGLPVEVDGQVVYSPPAWARRLASAEGPSLLFLDEINTAAPSVAKALLRVVQERVVGELELGPQVRIVAAANPPDVAVDGDDLAAPVANRFVHLDWSDDDDVFFDGLADDFASASVSPLGVLLSGGGAPERRARVRGSIAGFLRTRRDLLSARPADPTRAGRGWPSKRSWHAAARALGELDASDDAAVLTVLAGCVGEAAATEYVAWAALNDTYDPLAVLDDPSIVDWAGDRPDRLFALMSSVVALVAYSAGDTASHSKLWASGTDALVACAGAGRPDVAYPAVRQLLAAPPVKLPPLGSLQAAFADLLGRQGRWAGQDDLAAA